MFRLAHLSDIHLGPLPRAPFGALLSKRLFGFANWQRSRRRHHTMEALAAIVAHLHDNEPDHVAVTGDLVNLALPGEFLNALAWLRALGTPNHVSVVPGNHDAYVALPSDEGFPLWRDFMTSLPHPVGGDDAVTFPFVRKIGRISLIGVSSACPTRPFSARGTVGAAQLERLKETLRTEAEAQAFRILMIHHPPFPDGTKRHKRLTDSEPLQAILKDVGAELVLYGHNHRARLSWLDGPSELIPVVGAPSASVPAKRPYTDRGGYALIDIDVERDNPKIELQRFGYDGSTVRAVTPRLSLNGPEQGTIADLLHAAATTE